jgi:hypothetical protein
MTMNRQRGIRWQLFQIQLVGIVPVGLFAAALLYLHWQPQEHERQRAQIESVQLLAAAVDNSLDSSVERLSIFARLWSSRSLSEDALYAQAKEALKANADWLRVLAVRADGRTVFRTDAPFGPDVPPVLPFDTWRSVFATSQPAISDLAARARTAGPCGRRRCSRHPGRDGQPRAHRPSGSPLVRPAAQSAWPAERSSDGAARRQVQLRSPQLRRRGSPRHRPFAKRRCWGFVGVPRYHSGGYIFHTL